MRIEGNLFKKKYAQKKHFVLEKINNCEEEINSKPQERIANIDLCRCGCKCKPMATFGKSFFLLLWPKSRSAMGASRHSNSIEDICQILLEILNAMKFLKLRPIKFKHAPQKPKLLIGNHKSDVSKKMRRETMNRSQLKSTANKTEKDMDLYKFRKQRNLVLNLNKKKRKRIF